MAYFCAGPKSGPGFPTPWSFFMFNDLMREVIVCFVDTGGIVTGTK
jgi:hypothetical protein